MKRIGYCVPILPDLASFRLRVAIPAPHTGLSYIIGDTAHTSFFFKVGDPERAQSLHGPVVYDVVNDHFTGKHSESYRAMCDIADAITCASEVMAETVKRHTGRDATVIDDPWENVEQGPICDGAQVLWFGHSANIGSLNQYLVAGRDMAICTNMPAAANGGRSVVPWSAASERKCLDEAAVVLLTGSNLGASTNRIVKAIRAGRFVVTPGGVDSWQQFAPYCWIGDVDQGIEWALNNREEACQKVRAGQEWVRDRYSPETIGQQWRRLFDSI